MVAKAQQMGAAWLLAPEKKTDPLTNLGSVALSPAQLMNGASLASLGLLNGGASALLDGVNDYIDTRWDTRTNLCPTPIIEGAGKLGKWGTASGFWLNSGSALSTQAITSPFAGEGAIVSPKCTTTGALAFEGLQQPVTVKKGVTYRISIYIRGVAGGEELQVGIGNNIVGVKFTTVTLAGAGSMKRFDITYTPIESGECFFAVRTPTAKAVAFWCNWVLIEPTAELGEYFPKPSDLASSLAGWGGTAYEAASDLGPFARGTARTFTWVGNCLGGKTNIIWSSGSQTYAYISSSGNWHITFDEESTQLVAAATQGITVIWTLTLTAAGVATLYENGVQKVTGTLGRTAATGRFYFGGEPEPFGLNNNWRTEALPAVGFLKVLTEDQIKELVEQWSRVAILREFPPDKIAVKLIPPTGSPNRIAEDEPKAENILTEFTCSDEIPGGPKEGSFTLARDPRSTYMDLSPYTDAIAMQPGGEVIWRGSMDKSPSETSDHSAILANMLGYQYILEDNQAVKVGFIDGDLTKWGAPSAKRIKELNAASITLEPDPVVGFAVGSAIAALLWPYLRLTKGSTGNEAWYYGGGIDIGKLLYNFVGTGIDAAWSDVANIAANPDTNFILNTNWFGSKDYDSTSSSQQALEVAAAGMKYAWLTITRLQGESELDPYRGTPYFEAVKVLGTHGLAPKGTWPEIGFSAKQMIEYLLQQFGTPIEVVSSAIEDDGYIVPQAWYEEGQSLTDIIHDITKYGLYDWFIGYTGKRFELRIPGSYGRFWKTQITPSELEETGEDSQRLWRSIVVKYTDVSGVTKVVGPPGTAGADATSPFLEITDPEHPAVKAGRTRRDILDLQGISTPALAVEVGIRFLEEANLLNSSGSATLSGYVTDQYGIFRPAAQVKSGDWISFTDSNDKSYRKIVGKTYDHSNRASSIDIDAPPAGLEALLERLQAGLISQGVN